MLAQPAELVTGGGEIAACAQEEGEEGVECKSAADEGGGEAGHSCCLLGVRGLGWWLLIRSLGVQEFGWGCF